MFRDMPAAIEVSFWMGGQRTDRQMEEQTDVEVEIVIHIYDLLGCTYICDISFDKGFEIILFLQSKKSKLKFII